MIRCHLGEGISLSSRLWDAVPLPEREVSSQNPLSFSRAAAGGARREALAPDMREAIAPDSPGGCQQWGMSARQLNSY
jgi:hypothetical protein